MNEIDRIDAYTEAGRWHVRLQRPECTADDRAACAQWRARSPANEAAFATIEGILQCSSELADDPEMADALREADQNPASRLRAGFPYRLPLLAAVAVTTLATAALLLPKVWPDADLPGVPYATALGERRDITLPDGTAVVLDTRSALVERYSKDIRLVELASGQARFQVQRDPARSFVVRVAGGTVTAVGTQFHVRADDAGNAVTLLEGSVVVQARADGPQPERKATLSPGDRLRFDRDGRQWSTDRVDLEVADAWTQGSVLAKDWRLDDLIKEMNRYSATQLRLADTTLADVRISGAFRTGDQQSLVRVLQHGWQVHATQGVGDELLLTRQVDKRR